MKHQFLFIILMVTAMVSGQNTYKSGYFITNDGVRTDCLIKDMGWKNNPTSFSYKLGVGEESQSAGIEQFAEFAVPGVFKFVKAKTDIDRTGAKFGAAALKKASEFTNETLFLKVLIEGDFILYHYFDNGLERFFYKVGNGEIKPLVFKYYYPLAPGQEPNAVKPMIDRSTVFKNYQFRNQLWNDVKCPSTKMDTLEKLEYKVRDLMRYFEEVNTCVSTKK